MSLTSRTMQRALEASTRAVVAERLRAAHTHWTRLKGLLGTRELPSGEGLWIKPCRQVHMFGMRYPVDLVFLDGGSRVVHVVRELAPNRVSPKIDAAESVLELPAGTVAKAGLVPGVSLAIEGEAASGSNWMEAAGALACNVFLAGLYALFAAVHFAHARRTGEWLTTMPIVAQEALLVALFLARRRAIATSPRPFDWAVGIAGTFLPLLLRTSAQGGLLRVISAPLQIAGLGWALLATGSLGRSLAIVAANRGVKTDGLYRVVRHPMYAGYMLSYAGYLAAYPTYANFAIVIVTALALNARAVVEERFLARDPRYAELLQRVRWRFVPFVY